MPGYDIFSFVIVFIFGAVIGSFLNVCIYRLPLSKSIVFPASHCPVCKSTLSWYCNIPILSYVFLRGRCMFCKKSISWRYPVVELVNALLYVLIFYFSAFSLVSLVLFCYVSSMVVITFIDIDHQIIPDVISLPGIVLGFAASFVFPWMSWMDSLLGILLGGGSLLAIAYLYAFLTGKEGMGGGDIKLLAMIGAFMGYKAVLPIIFFSSVMGTVVGVPLMLIKKADKRLAIPFGPFLALASLIYLFAGPQIVQWYLRLLQ